MNANYMIKKNSSIKERLVLILQKIRLFAHKNVHSCTKICANYSMLKDSFHGGVIYKNVSIIIL